MHRQNSPVNAQHVLRCRNDRGWRCHERTQAALTQTSLSHFHSVEFLTRFCSGVHTICCYRLEFSNWILPSFFFWIRCIQMLEINLQFLCLKDSWTLQLGKAWLLIVCGLNIVLTNWLSILVFFFSTHFATNWFSELTVSKAILKDSIDFKVGLKQFSWSNIWIQKIDNFTKKKKVKGFIVCRTNTDIKTKRKKKIICLKISRNSFLFNYR